MNNSRITLDVVEPHPEDLTEKYQEDEAKDIRIIEAIREVSQTAGWRTLKEELFDKLPVSLEKELKAEAKKDDPDPKRLNRLSGELKWAEKYADLGKLEESFKLDLQRIRIRLNGTSD